MNYQKVLKSLKKVSYLNIINYYYPLFEKKLKFIFLSKNRLYLRNSGKSDDIFKKKLGKNLDFDEFKRVFFNKEIFGYSNSNEKSNIIEELKKLYIRGE